MHLGKTFKYYWPHVKRYPRSVITTFAAYGVGAVLMHLVIPIIYKEIVDVVSSGDVDPTTAGAHLLELIVFLAIAAFAYNIFYRIGDWAIVYSQSGMLKDIANDAYKRLHAHSYEFFTNRFAGSLVTKLKRFVRSFETIHDQAVFAVWFDGIKLISTIIALAWFAPPLLAVFLVWLSLYVVFVYRMTKIQFRKDVVRAAAESNTTAVLADTITNVLNIKMFAAWIAEKRNFDAVTGKEKEARDHSWYYHNWQNAFQGFYIALFEVLIMYFAIKMWIAGAITGGVIILAQIYVFKAFEIVWNIGRNARRVMEAFADAQEMVEIFETPLEVLDAKHPEKCTIQNGKIEVRNISFAYEKGQNVFEDFSVTIQPGEKVGLVGHSGSGKTTITKLLLRFTDVQKGEITIDGQNIVKIKQEDLRKNISYVPQEPMLFHRGLSENIAYGAPEATQDEIEIAAARAHAHEFIERLPEGYNTLVGERGIKLSGGERQRVAIARAMLKNAPILILDEATSALDSVSEKHIQAAFDTLMEGRTTLVIAHRLSTIQKMDRIIVFDKGRIIESGSHQELLEKEGEYYTFWKQQNHGMLPD
jgi:ATP-binding cassette subfamily B protein